MISEAEARARILAGIKPLPARTVPLSSALGRFAAEDLFARIPLPVFDNSAMDGYAITSCRAGARFRIVGEQPAGLDRKLTVGPGEAVRIFTGAPMPKGADAVTMQEDVDRNGDGIIVKVDVDPGEFIRRRGRDLSEGQKIVSRGEQIGPATIALLASQGLSEVSSGAAAGVAILSTGDELAEAGASLQPGQIYETNSLLLGALVEQSGAEVNLNKHCRDDLDSLVQTIKEASKQPVLVLTGGVSVGEHDLVRAALQSLGARIDIWRVAIKPGKPFLFGFLENCAVFGLPGNPVSAFVTFLQFVRPAILKMMGASNLALVKFPARLGSDLSNPGDRAHYFRGKYDHGNFSPIGRQESHALFGLSQANAILRLDAGAELKAGAAVEIETWKMFGATH